MTSSNGNNFLVTGLLCVEFTDHRWIPTQRPVARSFDVFFDLRLRKRPNSRRCLETPSRLLWRHRNVTIMDEFRSGQNVSKNRFIWSHFLSFLQHQNVGISLSKCHQCEIYWWFGTECSMQYVEDHICRDFSSTLHLWYKKSSGLLLVLQLPLSHNTNGYN